ncbi:MAG TPA: hypothetical protein DCK76_00305 [Desulfotomaculum sp.]|nr:MAG: putative membrane protein [Desulfotomaculum sp. 46_80]HAG09863.1 hypothetical protein [Desulfotomaculum sp.]HBY03862.1 hypothetical protein [Desulfotomaculum sp.]
MKWEEFLLFLAPGVPEVVGVIALSLALGAVPLRWGRIIPAGFMLAIISYVIRNLPGVPLFTHLIVELLVLVLIISKSTKVPLSKSFIIVFSSTALLAILEPVIVEIFIWGSGMSIEALSSNNLLWLFSGLLQAFLMILAAIITTKYIKPDREAWKL